MADASSSYEIDVAKLRAVLAGPNSEPMRKILSVTRRTKNAAILKSPVDTGGLRQSHRVAGPSIQGNIISASLVADKSYAAAVHDGSRPHLIKPRTKRALSWVGPSGRVFANVVRHPGAPKRPWLLNAAEEVASGEGFTVTPGG